MKSLTMLGRKFFVPVLAGVLMASAVAASYAGVAKVGDEQEAIHVRSTQGLDVQLTPKKKSFKPNEPIQFTVKGNQDFYLYLFSIDDAENKAVMILPNRFDANNKVLANKPVSLPSKGVEFYSDRVGMEKLVVLASSKELEFSGNIKFEQLGQFKVAPAKEMATEFESVKVRSTQKPDESVVVQEISLRIGGADAPLVIGAHSAPVVAGGIPLSPMVFVAANQAEYRAGDAVRVMFGADQNGWVSVYLQKNKAKRTLLTREKIATGMPMHYLDATAGSAMGDYKLVAVYSADKPNGESESLASAASQETIRVRSEKVAIESVYSFTITKGR